MGVEQRVAHIGFDDIEMSDVVRPGVSVCAQDPTRLGQLACELLFRRLDGWTGPPGANDPDEHHHRTGFGRDPTMTA